MTSRAPDLETILERLEKIENENRFLRRMGLLILLVSGASLTVGPTVGSFEEGRRNPHVEEFVLRDGSGNVRGKLVVSGNTPRLTLYDAERNPGSPLRTEQVRFHNSDEMKPDIVNAEVLIKDGAPDSERDGQPAPNSRLSALGTLGWQNPSLIDLPDWKLEDTDPEPQFGQYPPSVPDQPQNAIVAPAGSWQPTGSVQSAGQGSALLAEVGGLLHAISQAVRLAWEPLSGGGPAFEGQLPDQSRKTVEGEPTLGEAQTKLGRRRVHLDVEEIERARAQVLALDQISGQSPAANAQGDEASFPQSGALDQTAMPLPARSFAGSANLDQAPTNQDTQAGVIAQLPRQPFPYRYPVIAPVTSTTVTPSTAPNTTSGGSSPATPAPSGTAFVPLPAAQSASASSASPVRSPATNVPAATTAPNVTLKILGYVDKPGVGREIVISDDYEVYVTHEGETFAERFKVLKITPGTVDVLDTKTNQTVRLNLSQ